MDLERLQSLLFRRLRDPDTQRLIGLLLAGGARVYRTAQAQAILGPPRGERHGLPLGSYLSQWCGNLYLDGLDHFVKRTLKVPGYLRYMDDFVLFSNDREQLVDASAAVAEDSMGPGVKAGGHGNAHSAGPGCRSGHRACRRSGPRSAGKRGD